MKTKKQIEKMIDLVTRFRAVVPSLDGFGGDNHGRLDGQAEELKKCIGKDVYDLEDRIGVLGELDPMLEDEKIKARVEAVDWVTGDIDDMLDEEEVAGWEKRAGNR